MKIVRLPNHITVVMKDGNTISRNDCNDELYELVLKNQEDEDTVRDLLLPEFASKKKEYETKMSFLSGDFKSKYLIVKGVSVYIPHISELSVPEDLAIAIYEAEQKEDKDLLNTYLNFWTLASTNPDSRARTNLFWFLKKYGMTISLSGLFVAYRNVVIKQEGSEISSNLSKAISDAYTKVKMKNKKSPKNYNLLQDKYGEYFLAKLDSDKKGKVIGNLKELYSKLSEPNISPVYTDSYSHSFTIKIGEPVTMPREKCDSKQENTCSRGLHVAGRDWLQANYFGNQSLIVLVNPADVVAVPPEDSYGKMRVCAYYPVALVERDKEGNIINDNIPDGFEDDFIDKISYQGEVNNEEIGSYKLNIPMIPELNKDRVYNNIETIKQEIANRYVN